MKSIFTKLVFTIITFCFVLTANAQDTSKTKPAKIKEFGLGFTGLNNYSLQYRCGTEKHLFRITGNIGGSQSNQNSNGLTSASNNATVQNKAEFHNPLNVNLGINLSCINLKYLNDKFGLICGSSIGFQFIHNNISQNTTTVDTAYTQYNASTNESSTLSPSIGLILGGFYKLNSNFFIYAEVNPSLYYSYTLTDNNNSRTLDYTNPNISSNYTSSGGKVKTYDLGLSNITNSNASLTLIYRFTK